MRLSRLIVAAAIVSASFAAHADTITQNFSVSGDTGARLGSGNYGVASSSFAKFDSSMGTLNSYTIALEGTAFYNGTYDDYFAALSTAGDPQGFLGIAPEGSTGSGSFRISAAGSDSDGYTLAAYFVGAGTQQLLLQFGAPTSNVAVANGRITYDFTPTPTTAVTPEPCSLVLLATGLLSALGVARRRLMW